MQLAELIPIVQMAVGPVILISGVGMLLLTMTNRYGRVIDRARILVERRHRSDFGAQRHILPQIEILMVRAHLLRLAIALSTLCILLTSFLIIAIFLAAAIKLEIARLLILFFIAAMASLIASLVAFMLDINRSLVALKLEVSCPDQEPSANKHPL